MISTSPHSGSLPPARGIVTCPAVSPFLDPVEPARPAIPCLVVDQFVGQRFDTALAGPGLQEEYQELITGVADLPAERTHEYGPYIIEAIETNRPARTNGNVPNRGLIDNLPAGCCVEVPCLVDSNGIQPTAVGALPTQLAALNRPNINVQERVVEAALLGDTGAVYHAVMLDPLTAAICTLLQIRSISGRGGPMMQGSTRS